ncbi:hypothetical protein KR222_001608 [Zaprionus bogoriensis]|nr:hypothetical protein KR222_001608 [Zaprionus bogoriensis]
MGVVNQYIAALSAAFGAFCLGASIGWSGPMEAPITEGEAYSFSPTSDDWGWISSMLTFGAGCICIPIGILISIFGRKLIMLVLVVPYLIGWALILLAKHVSMLYIGRYMVGACGGAFCVTAPMYTTEIAQVDLRGVMGCFFQLLIVHGILYGFVVGAYCSPMLVNVLCGILPIIFFVIFFWMPESPVYLVQKGKNDKAAKAMEWLRGDNPGNAAEMAAMAAEGNKEKPKVFEMLSRKVTIRGLIITIMLMLFQQFTGINAILFYATGIFLAANTGMSADMCTIVLGIVQVFATIAAIALVERIGRRILLLISAAVMCVTTLVMGCYFQWWMKSDVNWLPIVAISLFIVGFSMGFGPVPWLIMAELFSEDVKPICGSVVGTSSWLLAFLVTKLFPISLHVFGAAATFTIFAVISLLAFVFIIFLVPETKGKTLNEIQAELGAQ